MSVTILIPTALRSFVDRKSEVEVEGGTVGEALANLAAEYPDLKHQIYEDDVKLRGFVNIFVDGTNIKKLNGLETVVAAGATVMLVPAIAGGC
ncbi:MAG: MoaD/ThiS family protein [Victivallales bacterium]|nr:MoaD/ThiS family protein [Victivallales bacterium]